MSGTVLDTNNSEKLFLKMGESIKTILLASNNNCSFRSSES